MKYLEVALIGFSLAFHLQEHATINEKKKGFCSMGQNGIKSDIVACYNM
jgi:hypothetical protein